MRNLLKNFLAGLIITSFVFSLVVFGAQAKSNDNDDNNKGKSETKKVKILKEKTKSGDVKTKVIKKEIEKGKSEKSSEDRNKDKDKDKDKEKRKEGLKSESEEKKHGSFEIKGTVKESDLTAKTIILVLTKKNNKLGLKKGVEQKFSVNEKTVIRVNDVKLNFDELAAGLIVEAKGRILNGTSTLNRIEVKQRKFEIRGDIKTINTPANEIKVAVARAEKLPEIVNQEVDIKVIKNAKITKNDERKTFDSLVIGDRLNLKIFKLGDKIFGYRIVVREGNQGTGGTLPSTTTPPVATSTPATATTTISITSAGFSPASVEITKGSKVVFVNNDTAMHQPSSDPHPAHTDFPTFGTGTALNAGESFEFTFEVSPIY